MDLWDWGLPLYILKRHVLVFLFFLIMRMCVFCAGVCRWVHVSAGNLGDLRHPILLEQELQGLGTTSYRGLGTQLRLSAQAARGLNLSAISQSQHHIALHLLWCLLSIPWLDFVFPSTPHQTLRVKSWHDDLMQSRRLVTQSPFSGGFHG